MPDDMAAVIDTLPRFLDVKQAAEYLNLNEKKIYALVSEGLIPGTTVTGKRIFPRELIDRWMLESSHGGLLTDRLMLAGSDDPLQHRVVQNLARDTGARAMVSYSPPAHGSAWSCPSPTAPTPAPCTGPQSTRATCATPRC